MYIGTRSTKEVLTYPCRRFTPLDESFPAHCFGSRRLLLRPDKSPRAVLAGVLRFASVLVVVFSEASLQIVGVADIEPPSCVLKDIHPELPRFICQTPGFGRLSNAGNAGNRLRHKLLRLASNTRQSLSFAARTQG